MNASVHDIVALDGDARERIAREGPSWVCASLRRAPFAVVRREQRCGAVCVGIRGEERAQRYAAYVTADEVLSRVAPEALVDVPPPRSHGALRAIRDFASAMHSLGIRWGPAGAAGFELATRVPVLHEASDLDVVLRLTPNDVRLLAVKDALRGIDVRVDAELSFGNGYGVALEEALCAETLLVKTPDGPRLFSLVQR